MHPNTNSNIGILFPAKNIDFGDLDNNIRGKYHKDPNDGYYTCEINKKHPQYRTIQENNNTDTSNEV